MKLENGGTTIKVRVTMHTVQSTVPSAPPTTHGIRYRFTVQADVDGQTQWSDPKDSEEMSALWRMPSGLFTRYGQPPDTGLDDWASRGAYDWLTRNAGLFANTSINDISGEHARDLVHKQHYRGVEIDIFQFKKITGAWNTDSNYKLLRKNVIDALNGNQPAKAVVTDWVTKTRAGFDGFLPLADVEKLYTTIGSVHKVGGVEVLPDGWGEALIKNGTFTIGTQTLDLAIGVWSNATNAKMVYDDIHNDHGHITLDATKLIK